MRQNKDSSSEDEKDGPREGHLLLNIGKTIFLIAVLVVFWFFFEWWLARK